MIHIKQTHHKLTNEQTALKMENPKQTQIEIHVLLFSKIYNILWTDQRVSNHVNRVIFLVQHSCSKPIISSFLPNEAFPQIIDEVQIKNSIRFISPILPRSILSVYKHNQIISREINTMSRSQGNKNVLVTFSK